MKLTNVIVRFFLWMFSDNDILQAHFNRHYGYGRDEERRLRQDQIEGIHADQMYRRIGKFVISVSNEWRDPVIGCVRRIEYISRNNSPVFVVFDYITQEEKLCFGKMRDFSMALLDGLLAIDPEQRWNLVALSEQPWSFNKKTGQIHSASEIRQILSSTGFFKDLFEAEISEIERREISPNFSSVTSV